MVHCDAESKPIILLILLRYLDAGAREAPPKKNLTHNPLRPLYDEHVLMSEHGILMSNDEG